MKKGKYLLLTVTAAALLAAIPFQAFASKDTEDRSPVGSIGLNVSSSIHVGDESSDVDVSLDFGDCDISNVDVINEPSGKWVDKDKPKLEVTLEADDDYYFKYGYAKKNVTLSGDSATVTSIKRKGDEELRVVITLKALKGTSSDYSLDVDEAEWDQMDGVAEWNGSEDAKYYELRVYRDEKFLSTVKPGKKRNTILDVILRRREPTRLMCARFTAIHGTANGRHRIPSQSRRSRRRKFRRRLSSRKQAAVQQPVRGNRMHLAISTAIPMEAM